MHIMRLQAQITLAEVDVLAGKHKWNDIGRCCVCATKDMLQNMC
jgi:hypothetical protein